MRVVDLTSEQVTLIYKNHMINDFPASERKPLNMILKAMDAGTYECNGLEDNGRILGYAFFYRAKDKYLFDYLAIIDGERNNGLGSEFLKLLSEHYADAECIVGEAEDPEYAKDEKERSIRKRRIDFYARNGLVDTGIRVKLFHVHFVMLEMTRKNSHSKEELKKIYKNIYRTMLPYYLYLLNVKVKK